jgi:wobble nucleotide-excising tRNase
VITEIHMDDVASYRNPVDIPISNKVTLAYGLNGAGKSTISNYLYNPQDPKYKRCHIREDSEHEVLVYNQLFLKDYFYEEDALKGIFSLSKENKDVLEAIEKESKKLETLELNRKETEKKKDEIENQLKDSKNEVIDKVWEIKQKYSGGDRVLEYCFDGLKRKEKIFEYLLSIANPADAPQVTTDDLKAEVSAIADDSAQPIIEIPEILFDGIQIEEDTIFEKVIVGSQEGSVAEFIANMGHSDWVRKGLSYLPEEAHSSGAPCPFCQVKTVTNKLIDSIRNVFDDSYNNDLDYLESCKASYVELESELRFGEVSNISVVDKIITHKWKALTENVISRFRENKLLIEKKIGSPSTPVKLLPSSADVEALNALIQHINTLIRAYNDKLNNKKQALDDIKNRFWFLMRLQYGQLLDLLAKSQQRLDDELARVQKDIEVLSSEILSVKSNISSLRKKTVNIQEAIDNINSGLAEIGVTGFSVVPHGVNLYRVLRADDHGNAFHSLSEGEKTVISFLYFVELCKGQKSTAGITKKKVVVIDDPISSLSHIYVFNIGQLIKRTFCNSAAFEQVLILTHSLYFFYELTYTKKADRDQLQNLFRIIKNTEGSNVVRMKYEEIQNDYQTYWSIVKDESSPPALIANCMRNIIEYFFNFVQKMEFCNVFQKPSFKDDKYQAFYRYMNRESHSLGQNIFDIKEFDYAVFRDGLRLVFEECGYSEHYKAMTK